MALDHMVLQGNAFMNYVLRHDCEYFDRVVGFKSEESMIFYYW